MVEDWKVWCFAFGRVCKSLSPSYGILTLFPPLEFCPIWVFSNLGFNEENLIAFPS